MNKHMIVNDWNPYSGSRAKWEARRRGGGKKNGVRKVRMASQSPASWSLDLRQKEIGSVWVSKAWERLATSRKGVFKSKSYRVREPWKLWAPWEMCAPTGWSEWTIWPVSRGGVWTGLAQASNKSRFVFQDDHTEMTGHLGTAKEKSAIQAHYKNKQDWWKTVWGLGRLIGQ